MIDLNYCDCKSPEECGMYETGKACRKMLIGGFIPKADTALAHCLLTTAAKSGDPGAIRLAAQLAGVPACEKCGYVIQHCRCEPVATMWREENIELYPGVIFNLTEEGKALLRGVRYKLYAKADIPDKAAPVEAVPEHIALLCEAYDFAQFSSIEQLNQLPLSVFNALHKLLGELQEFVLPAKGVMPVIYVDHNGKLISRVSAEQIEAVLGPHIDAIRESFKRVDDANNQL